MSQAPPEVVRCMLENYSIIFGETEEEYFEFEQQRRNQKAEAMRESLFGEGEEEEEKGNGGVVVGVDGGDCGDFVGLKDSVGSLGRVVKEGWLGKKTKKKNLKRYWFVLGYGSLAYFRSPGFLFSFIFFNLEKN